MNVWSSRQVHAGLVLSFSADGNTSTFSVEVGQAVTIPVFLRQFGDTTGEPDLASDLLVAYAFQADLDNANSSISGFAVGSGFSDLGSSFNASSAVISAISFDGVSGTAIELGSLTIDGAVAGTSMLTLSDSDTGLDDFATDGTFSGLDANVFSPVATATIFVSVVPEPSSTALLLASAAAALLSRRRRRIDGNAVFFASSVQRSPRFFVERSP